MGIGEKVTGKVKEKSKKAGPFLAAGAAGAAIALTGTALLTDGYPEALREETHKPFDTDEDSKFNHERFLTLPFPSNKENLEQIRRTMYANYGTDPESPSAEAQYAVNCGIIAASGLTGRLEKSMQGRGTQLVSGLESDDEIQVEASEGLYDDVATACARLLDRVVETHQPPMLSAPLGLPRR